ncbi:MAG: YfhO family protein [Bacteroidaceae bacterium]|nr:YfhO family protein [Bacteroidaceae bacterium]
MLAFFVVVSVAYFWPPISEGTVLTGTDHNAADGLAVEMNHYRDTHDGERTRWTNSLFSGMPTYQIAPAYPSTETLSGVQTVYSLGLKGLSDYASYVFLMLIGFYILLRAFDFRAWMAALGAVLWAFSSYYFIIIAAGHIWKLLALSFIPPTIAGLVLCYRGKYVWGIVVTGLFTALQVVSNHVQMSYYFLFVMGLMVLAYLVEAIRDKALTRWLKASGAALVGGLLGLCINASNLYHTYEYSKESMRGKSELTQKTKDAADQTSSGLERSYITAWSYGIDETWTLLIPNTKGGASMPLSRSKEAMAKADPQFQQVYQQLGQYWGDQPMTSGPVYVGAFVLFLFVLGLLIVKGPMKWALLAATVLSVLLSWGRNFMPFTDFFLDYVPMYDKFRTVASILVIAEFTIPMLGMLALKEVVELHNAENPDPVRQKWVRTSALVSFGLTAGVCFLFWLMPDVFFGNYMSQQEQAALAPLTQYGWPPEVVNALMRNLNDMRRAVFTADAMRSLIVIVVGFAVLVVYRFRRIGEWSMVACITLLCLVDMWGVNKRYLSDDMFVQPNRLQQTNQKTQADELILQDPDTYYRVLNMAVSTFNDNSTSYFHKSIGGYHAAKLRRYQELIEEHISKEMPVLQQAVAATSGMLDECNGDSLFPVLNMLNMKYVELGLQGGGRAPVQNPWVNGNAWFVDDIQYVADADAEIDGLHYIDTKHQAIADERFRAVLGEAGAEGGTTELTKYEANELHYAVESSEGGVLVFSEIYYPGWTCTVDGKATEVGRVNYVLRAIHVGPGRHEVVMTFKPSSITRTETIAYGALIVLALLLAGALLQYFWRGRK